MTYCRKSAVEDASDTDTTSGDVLESKSKRDEDFIFDRKKPSKHSFVTNWGPVGFQKKLHPLSIMVGHCMVGSEWS